ncbi:peptidoglycan-binding protein [Streptomyces sp. NPDC059534]|uniref:peptidoglycan-binding domain-containing protein n=1 Tax=Streptomyces sp. NPDC059534 TaxID=3346859 RepID=UPI003699E020
MSLPLMVAGALSAGVGAALTVWLGTEPAPGPPSGPSLTLPVVVALDRPSVQDVAGAPSASRTTAARSTSLATPSAGLPHAPTPTSTPSSTDTPSPTGTSAPAPSPVAASTRPPASHRPHRTPRPEPRDPALGSTGPQVADLQRRLQQLYLYLGSADGVFTETVGEGLRRYQVARGIPEEYGVYGPLTRANLRSETD